MSSFELPSSFLEELEEHGSFASVTKGVSMRPLFKTNRDMVVIVKPEGELKKYDVALYRNRRGSFTLHRVVGVKDDVYLIRGDNTYFLEKIPKKDIVGVLSSFVRNGKSGEVTDLSYRLYSKFWNFIYPVRYLLFRIRLFLGKIYRKIFKRKK